jgi:hypothetical protein
MEDKNRIIFAKNKHRDYVECGYRDVPAFESAPSAD